ncbi:aldo/keto reductase [Kineococcus sp. SYSU DK003]|uniref:aldo/keto reductase n=1 Tax=Kineococcus sp. SYSU DK003 TaxID=3383124 RepID=UPI003D7D1DE2
MKQRSLGRPGAPTTRQVSAIGLGAMPLSIEGRPDTDRAIATIHAALDAGVTLIDTADAYHRDAGEVGHNEELIARALREYGSATDDVVVATKGGSLRPGDGTWYQKGDPAYLKEAAKASAQRLGVEAIGLYQFHRPDPNVPFADSVGALAELLDEGVIVRAGISNADVAQIDEADAVLSGRLTSVQNQFSPAFLSSRGELEHCAQQGISFLPWSPLGGISNAAELGSRHAVFAEVAGERGVSPQQVALAWELSLADQVLPIPGSSRPASIQDSLAAADLVLSGEELTRLAEGTRS